jgi:hypothetical protein
MNANTNDPSAALNDVLKAVPAPAKLKELLAAIDAKIAKSVADLKATRASRVTLQKMMKIADQMAGKAPAKRVRAKKPAVAALEVPVVRATQEL